MVDFLLAGTSGEEFLAMSMSLSPPAINKPIYTMVFESGHPWNTHILFVTSPPQRLSEARRPWVDVSLFVACEVSQGLIHFREATRRPTSFCYINVFMQKNMFIYTEYQQIPFILLPGVLQSTLTSCCEGSSWGSGLSEWSNFVESAKRPPPHS